MKLGERYLCLICVSYLQAIKSILGKVKLKEGQLRVLATKAKEIIGSPDKWTKDDIKELGNIIGGLLPSELKQIGDQVIKDSLQFLKDVDFKIDQVKRGGWSDITHYRIQEDIRYENIQRETRGGSRGRVQGVRTPPPP